MTMDFDDEEAYYSELYAAEEQAAANQAPKPKGEREWEEVRWPRGTPLGSLQRVPMCGRGPGFHYRQAHPHS